MTQEEKELLLKDLCARLPHGVVINIPHIYRDEFKAYLKAINPEREIVYYEICGSSSPLFDRNILGIKPYLRPMSSMTEEEKKELKELHFYYTDGHIVNDEDKDFKPIIVDEVHCFCIIDWLNAHHFDYRGLIEKGLALEAPEGMYKEG